MDTSIDSLEALKRGKIAIQGEFLWGSNYTFLVQVETDGGKLPAVYKPSRGERPLWDFPTSSLAKREAAAFWVSQALGWELVPPTVYRSRGPIGAGSVQLYIDHDPEYHYFNFSPEDHQRLRPTVLFDLLINNADRKGSHILVGENRHIWLIDHGVCFHVEDKLRTVIWNFAGEKIPEEYLADLRSFVNKLEPIDEQSSELWDRLVRLLNRGEIRAMAARAKTLIYSGIFPAPDPHRRPFPWPAI